MSKARGIHACLGVAVAVAIGLGTVGRAQQAARPGPPEPLVIFLHYDYMVKDVTDSYGPAHSDAPYQASIDLVVDSFKRRGIQVVIDHQHNIIPYHRVLGIPNCMPGFVDCEPFADLAQLRAQYFDPHGHQAWHYMIFAESVYDGNNDGNLVNGTAELPGQTFVLGVGYLLRGCDSDGCVRMEAATLMHELGHNLDLRHGGGDDENYKPNYISVMNYLFENVGIRYAASPGSTTVAGYRVDYSDHALPDLNENALDERVGLGGPPSDCDISTYMPYWDDGNDYLHSMLIPSRGPVDWNQNGVIEQGVQFDANFFDVVYEDWGGEPEFGVLHGFDDWTHVKAFLRTSEYVNHRVRPRAIVGCHHKGSTIEGTFRRPSERRRR